MGHDADDRIKRHAAVLAETAKEIASIGFSYKMHDSKSREYWEDKISLFERHRSASIKYYTAACILVRMVDAKEYGRFLLWTAQIKRLGSSLVRTMEMVRDNPTIMDKKDRMQSRWSKGIREDLFRKRDACLAQEDSMGRAFREFYQAHLDRIYDPAA